MEMNLDHLDVTAEGLVIVPEEDRNSPIKAALSKIIDLAREAIIKVRAEKTQLRKSGDLSESGLNRTLAEFGKGHIERLEKFERGHIERAKEEVARLEKRLAQIPTEAKGDAAMAKAIEIRTHLGKLTDSQRMAVMEESLESGETEVVSALFSSPVFVQRSLIAADDFRSDLRRRFLDQSEPGVADELADLKHLLMRAESAVPTARRKIAEEAGTTADSLPSIPTLLQQASSA